MFSGQVIEHLHPEDVPIHLKCVFERLKPGGRYIFDTPTGLTGHTMCQSTSMMWRLGFISRSGHCNEELRDELVKAGFVNIIERECCLTRSAILDG